MTAADPFGQQPAAASSSAVASDPPQQPPAEAAAAAGPEQQPPPPPPPAGPMPNAQEQQVMAFLKNNGLPTDPSNADLLAYLVPVAQQTRFLAEVAQGIQEATRRMGMGGGPFAGMMRKAMGGE